MEGLGFLSQAAKTKRIDATLLILINSFNFNIFHANGYAYTKSFCSAAVRELSEIAPFTPMEQELKIYTRPELDHFYPDFLSSPFLHLFLITVMFMVACVQHLSCMCLQWPGEWQRCAGTIP